MKVLNNQIPITKKDDIIFPQEMMPYVLHSSPDYTSLSLYTQLIKLTCSMKVILIDGTFSRCPVTHSQLVTLHAMTSSPIVTFPFMYILMSGKPADTTRLLSTQLRELLPMSQKEVTGYR